MNMRGRENFSDEGGIGSYIMGCTDAWSIFFFAGRHPRLGRPEKADACDSIIQRDGRVEWSGVERDIRT